MSSNTNQSSASPNQQHMAHLEHIFGPTTTQTTKQAKNSFIGTNATEKQSEEEAGGENTNNPPESGAKDLGRCRAWGERGKPGSQCTRTATVQPHKGKKEYLVFCAECWAVKQKENIKSCKKRRVTQKAKVKHEKQQILQVVDNKKLSELSLMEKQYQVITLGLPFMSQLVSVKNAFHSKLKSVRTDKNWSHKKKLNPNDAAPSRTTAARKKIRKVYVIIAPLAQQKIGKENLRVF